MRFGMQQSIIGGLIGFLAVANLMRLPSADERKTAPPSQKPLTPEGTRSVDRRSGEASQREEAVCRGCGRGKGDRDRA